MFSVVEIQELKSLNAAQIEKRLDRASSIWDAKLAKTTLNKKVTLGEYPGREVRQESLDPAKNDDIEAGRSRTFIVGTKLYLIIIMGKKNIVDSERTTQILESLKLDSK